MRLVLGWVVIAVWVGAAVDGLVQKDYSVLDRVTPIALIAAGSLFGIEIRRRNGKNGSSPPSDK